MDTAETLDAKINAISNWKHCIKLTPEITTPGSDPIDIESYRFPEFLEGKRVLDLNTGDGFWTFEALKRGASEVVSTKDITGFLQTSGTQQETWEAFDLCAETLNLSDKIKKVDISPLQINRSNLGQFDIVLFMDGLNQFRYPLLALDKASLISQEELYVSSLICDNFSPYKGGFGGGYPNGELVMEFYPHDEYQKDSRIWWIPTLHGLGNMVLSAGFNHIDGWKLVENPAEANQCRGVICGKKVKQ